MPGHPRTRIGHAVGLFIAVGVVSTLTLSMFTPNRCHKRKHVVSTPEIAWLGVSHRSGEHGGVEIGRVFAGSPAFVAGIRSGDVITQFGDSLVVGSQHFQAIVQGSRVGRTVLIHLRDPSGGVRVVTATLGKLPARFR